MRAAFILAILATVPAIAQVAYVENNAGLSLQWDGGRTVLKFADINHDGRLDILTVGDHGSPFINTQMHGVTVWFGQGSGGPGSGWYLFQHGNFGYGGIDVGDVNNDGLLDVAYGVHHNYSSTDLGDQVLEVALGDGSGMAWTPWDDNLGLQGQTWGMFGTALADIDADGWLDLASAAFGCCDGVFFYRNNADGTWTPLPPSAIGGNSDMDVFAGDVNNDGYPDFATSHQNGTVWINDAGTKFVSGDAGLPAGGILGRRGAHLHDVNHDGFDDLSFVDSANRARVFLSNPAGGWTDATANLPATPCQATRLIDMDADGQIDLVTFGSGVLNVHRGDGGASWTTIATITTPSPGTFAGMDIADVDRNGRPDIALVAREQTGTFSSRNTMRFFYETSPPDALSIALTSPLANRTWRIDSARTLAWRSEVFSGAASEIDLEISPAGPQGPWITIATGLPNVGRHQFTVDPSWRSPAAYLRATVRIATGEQTDVRGPIAIIGGCYPDCDGGGTLDLFDFLCFASAFNAGDPYADCDGDGQFTLFDFLCFTNAFNAACP